MTTIELMGAFRRAELEGFITNLPDYAECNAECDYCPANTACDFIIKEAKEISYSSSFDKLLPPSVFTNPQYSLKNIQNEYPEYFL